MPGITNKQARFLADLQRRNGHPYIGYGMSRDDATTLITMYLEGEVTLGDLQSFCPSAKPLSKTKQRAAKRKMPKGAPPPWEKQGLSADQRAVLIASYRRKKASLPKNWQDALDALS